MTSMPAHRSTASYGVEQRGSTKVQHLGIRAAPGINLDTWPDRFFVVQREPGAVPIAVAGPLAERECAELLAALHESEWRFLPGLARWFTAYDQQVYSAPPEPGPRLTAAALRPCCFADFGADAGRVRSFVEAEWPAYQETAPGTWRLHPTCPRALLSRGDSPVHFPATGDPVTPEEARANQRAVLAESPDLAGSPRPWRAVMLAGVEDWIVLDARRHVIVQCGVGSNGADSARWIQDRFGATTTSLPPSPDGRAHPGGLRPSSTPS